MGTIEKLRKLIWDEDYQVFTDNAILEEFLQDNNNNVYAAAAACLTLVRADPNRYKSYSIGPMSFTYQDLDRTIDNYRSMSARSGPSGISFATTEGRRTY